ASLKPRKLKLLNVMKRKPIIVAVPKQAEIKVVSMWCVDSTSMTNVLRSVPRDLKKLAGARTFMSEQALQAVELNDEHVISVIRQMAPSYGVPTWFALRIANVESGYNPYARGRAGEIGIYQLKCQTARGMGF